MSAGDLRVPRLEDFPDAAVYALVAVDPVTVRRRVEFGDCDPAGIVFTPRISNYVIDAFEWFMAVLLDDIGRNALPVLTFMRGLDLDFRRMMRWRDWVNLRIHVGEIRTRTFELLFHAVDDAEQTLFVARLTPITADRTDYRAAPLPDALRVRLEAYRARCGLPVETIVRGG